MAANDPKRRELGPWYTPRQAAPLLGIDVVQVRVMCAEGQLTCRRRGTPDTPRYQIPESAIDEYNRRSLTPARGRTRARAA